MKKLTTTMMQRTLNKQDGRLTIGLDLGDRSSFCCVLDEAGDVLLEQEVSTTPKALKEMFERLLSSTPFCLAKQKGVVAFRAFTH
jgi:predicted NBD/HSP70 family sugar kinase